MEDKLSRRKLLKQSSVLGLASLAGCVTDSGSEMTDTPTSAQPTATDETESPTTTEPKTTAEQTTQSTTTTEQDSPTHDHEQTEARFSEEIREKAQEVGVQTQKSVVKVSFNDGRGGGTGWQIDDEHILTNSHIARQSETFEIETFDGTTGSAERVGFYRDMIPDIALLRTDISGTPSLSSGDSSNLSKGDPMVIVGHPANVGDWVISLGPYQRNKFNWLLTDAPTNQGNSGSPLVTLEGKVVGCVSGTTTIDEEQGPISRSDEVFQEFPEPDEFVTATPIETIQDSVNDWK
ncbi:S1 family peptidase [Halobacterium hubeiense]|uniref:S1 family peptidase n=1 Tax=Halobacterium hubeiense TaxID=1407499 RepID=UPI003C777409